MLKTVTSVNATNGTVTNIQTGTGLTGGPITGTGTISLANTVVTAGSYGNASTVSQVTINAQGQVTNAVNVAIVVANSAVTGLGTMSTQNANNVTITGGTENNLTYTNVSILSGNVKANVIVTNATNATATYATSSLLLVPAGFIQISLANSTVVKVPYYAA
jgi:hypothetical protein